MPVNLDAIPDKAPEIPRPVTSRWAVSGVTIFLAGLGITLWFWPGERTGLTFWFTATCLPGLIWASAFTLRRIAYRLEQVGTRAWNLERERLMASEAARGQRYAWLMGDFLINALELKGMQTQTACINKSPMLEPVLARDGASVVRHSALPDTGKPADILNSYTADICGQIKPMLAKLPADMPCFLVFDAGENIADITDALLAGIDYPLRKFGHRSGFSLLDHWLDQHHDRPAALLIVSAQIYAVPALDSGESVAIMLLSNRRPSSPPFATVRIHRPQISQDGELAHALSNALLWAKLTPAMPLRGWTTGGNMACSETWSHACAAYAPELTAQRIVNIDRVAGYAGAAAHWQSVILAARQCRADGEPQIVAVESAHAYYQLCAVTPEKSVEVD